MRSSPSSPIRSESTQRKQVSSLCKTHPLPGSCVVVQQKQSSQPGVLFSLTVFEGGKQDHLFNQQETKKGDGGILMGRLDVHATKRVNRIQDSASRELNTWAKQWRRGQWGLASFQNLPNLIIPRLIREGLSCLSPSSGQQLLSLTQLYYKQTTVGLSSGGYHDGLKRAFLFCYV